jgi:hypothetical protein
MPGLGFRFWHKPVYDRLAFFMAQRTSPPIVYDRLAFFMAQQVSLDGPKYGQSRIGPFSPDPIDDPRESVKDHLAQLYFTGGVVFFFFCCKIAPLIKLKLF